MGERCQVPASHIPPRRSVKGLVRQQVLSRAYQPCRGTHIFSEWDFCIHSLGTAAIKHQSFCNELKVGAGEGAGGGLGTRGHLLQCPGLVGGTDPPPCLTDRSPPIHGGRWSWQRKGVTWRISAGPGGSAASPTWCVCWSTSVSCYSWLWPSTASTESRPSPRWVPSLVRRLRSGCAPWPLAGVGWRHVPGPPTPGSAPLPAGL